MNGALIANIFTDYPLATSNLVTYFESGIQLSGNEEMDKHLGPMKRNPDVAVKIVLSMGTPRFLYDFFDKQGIYVTIHYYHTPSPNFICYVNGIIVMQGTKREELEESAFVEAFKVFEKKLKDEILVEDGITDLTTNI